MDYLHNHKDFPALLNIVAQEMGIQPLLVEKDYWIMHVLYGLQQLNFTFELKGGTSLSKGYKIIHRFSEDIDISLSSEAVGISYIEKPSKTFVDEVKNKVKVK